MRITYRGVVYTVSTDVDAIRLRAALGVIEQLAA